MRKDPQRMKGGPGRIEVVYLVIWSQGMPVSKKNKRGKKIKTNMEKGTSEGLAAEQRRAWHQISEWGEVFFLHIELWTHKHYLGRSFINTSSLLQPPIYFLHSVYCRVASKLPLLWCAFLFLVSHMKLSPKKRDLIFCTVSRIHQVILLTR